MKKWGIFKAFCAIGLIAAFAGDLQAFDFSAHGSFRNRSVANDNLDLQKHNTSIPNTNNRFGIIAYNQIRLRVEPNLKINDHLALHGQFDFLDNLLYGTNNTRELNVHSPVIGTLTLPQGAGSFRMTGGTAGENGAINVRGVWGDILTPIGLFRIGRQPSHWGLGIFNHDGRNGQGDFGDFADRILYTLQYDVGGEGTISSGLLMDIAFESQVDPRVTGLQEAIRANSQDTYQWAAFLLYDQPDWGLGVFGGYRRRNGPEGATTTTVNAISNTSSGATSSFASGLDGNTNLFFGDLYARYQHKQYKFQLEGVYVAGKVTTGIATDGINFQGITAANSSTPCGTGGIICMPANQSIQAILAALEFEAEYAFGGAWNVKAGFAQGDGNILSAKITQLGFRPDYQVALMMFNMPLGTSPQFFDSSTGTKLAGGVPITGNYINNAVYVSTGYKHRFDIDHRMRHGNWIKVGGQVTTAWAHKKNINIDFAQLTGVSNLPVLSETANGMLKRWYGVEGDIIVEGRFFDNFLATFEGGVLIPGRAYDIEVSLIDPGSIIQTIPADKAELAWMARLTATVEF